MVAKLLDIIKTLVLCLDRYIVAAILIDVFFNIEIVVVYPA